MEIISDQILAALIGAVVVGLVNLGFDAIKLRLGLGKPASDAAQDKRRLTILLFIAGGGIAGFLLWSLIARMYQTTLFTFDQDKQSWQPLDNPDDGSFSTDHDLVHQELIAEYNFAQTDPNNPDPRATFYRDNVNNTWRGYKSLKLDVTNPGSKHLELGFSLLIRMPDNTYCFHEFEDYWNLPEGRTTIRFDFTEPRYKTCKVPDKFNQRLAPDAKINQLFLIVGTDETPADFRGTISIDNIRLERNLLPHWLLLAACVLLLIMALSGKQPVQPVKEISDAQPGS